MSAWSPWNPMRGCLGEARKSAGASDVDIEYVVACAESPPFGSATADLISVAQAFHWFDVSQAVPELRRALACDGTLVILYNVRQNDESWFLGKYEDLIDRYSPTSARDKGISSVLDVLRAHGSFAELSHESYAWQSDYDADTLVGFARTPSYLRQVLTEEELGRFTAEFQMIIRHHFGDSSFRIPYKAELFLAK